MGGLAITSETHALSHRSLAAVTLLSLVTACASTQTSAPVLEVERGDGVRAVHARVRDEQGSPRLELDLQTRFPGTTARRSVQVEGLAFDGRTLFTRELVADPLTHDARYHREQSARASLDLPSSNELATLRIRAGR